MTNKDLLLEKLTANLDFDLDTLREKYVHERDRRINTAGTQQYAEVSGDLAKFEQEDPYVETPLNRSPVSIETDVVIVGAGFSGLMSGARLTERGVTDFRIIDAAADFGGTWYWNRYPGAQSDIDAYCYLPLLEETGYMPKEKYSFAPEIFEHSKRIADYFDLYDRALFQTRVTELRWLEEESRWKVSTNRGDDIRAGRCGLAGNLAIFRSAGAQPALRSMVGLVTRRAARDPLADGVGGGVVPGISAKPACRAVSRDMGLDDRAVADVWRVALPAGRDNRAGSALCRVHHAVRCDRRRSDSAHRQHRGRLGAAFRQ